MLEHSFQLKRTTELSQDDTCQLMDLFCRVFNKEKTLAHFNREFLQTTFGFSYHGLRYMSDKLIGAYTAIPYQYCVSGKEQVLALSVDTMIDKNYRKGPFNLKKMADLVYKALADEGIPFVFGFPNPNSYTYLEQMLDWQLIGELSYYILPRRISFRFPYLALFDKLLAALASGYSSLAGLFASAQPHNFGVEKIVDESFFKYRYGPEHKVVRLNEDNYFVYTRYTENNGVVIWYIIDLYPLTDRMLCKANKYILDAERSGDMICYVGRLPFVPISMIKLPSKIIPRRLFMSGKVLIPGTVCDELLDIDRWLINLSNFDVR